MSTKCETDLKISVHSQVYYYFLWIHNGNKKIMFWVFFNLVCLGVGSFSGKTEEIVCRKPHTKDEGRVDQTDRGRFNSVHM